MHGYTGSVICGRRIVIRDDDSGPASHGAGRVCAAEGCRTVLSRYNPSPLCCLHGQGWADPRESIPQRQLHPRPELVGSCLNPRCGAEFLTTNPAKRYCSDRCRMQAFQLRLSAGGQAAARTAGQGEGRASAA